MAGTNFELRFDFHTLVRLFKRLSVSILRFACNRLFAGWPCKLNCTVTGREREGFTNDLNYICFPGGLSSRAPIALVNLAALAMFVAVELGFSYFNLPTPRAMVTVATVAGLFRGGEFFLSRRPPALTWNRVRSRAMVSICAGVLIPFALAAATRQFHTHYFGLLILPVLEAALYFLLFTTLIVAAVASC